MTALKKICIVGLGYVGLPLATEFGKYRPVIGYDVNPLRINQLQNKFDWVFSRVQDLISKI